MQGIYTLFTEERKFKIYFLFLILSVLLYLPSTFFRYPFAPDEFRNLYIAKNINDKWDFLFPKYFDEFYEQKPPFYFWILKHLVNINFFNFLVLPIIFNVVVASFIFLLNYLILKKEEKEELALLSNLVLSTTAIFYAMVILVRMDILFLFFIFLSIFFFHHSLFSEKKIFIFLSSFFSFLATFTKGAFGIIFPLFIQITTSLILRNKKYFFKAIIINVFSIFFVTLWLICFSYFKKDYFYVMLFKQTILRATKPNIHRQPFYYYIFYIIPLFLPWSFFLFGYLVNLKKIKLTVWEKIYIVWLIGGFVILSMVKSKLPMYLVLLSIPASALVTKFFTIGSKVLINRLSIFTVLFLIVSLVLGFLFLGDNKKFLPQALFGFILFLLMLIAIYNKEKRIQLKNFFIFWVIVLEALNLVFIPIVSKSSTFVKIIDTVNSVNLESKKIYITDKNLATIQIFLTKPTQYSSNLEDIFNKDKPFILITREKNLAGFSKIAEIKDFAIFYKR